MRKQVKLPLKDIKLIILQIFNGLRHIHKKGIVHRDLKPQNILIDNRKHIYLCDFGSSKKITKGSVNTPYIVPQLYRAIELFFSEKNYTGAIDVWATGCILAEMVLGDAFISGSNEGQQLLEII